MRKRIVFAGLILAAVAFTVWRLRKVLLFSALTLAGRNPSCTLWQVVVTPGHYVLGSSATRHAQEQMRLLETDPEGYKLWSTGRGQFWAPTGCDFFPFDLGEQDRRICGTGPRAVRAGDVVLDCGANVGLFVKTALALGAGLVIAIEPGPENLVCLRRNCKSEIAAGRVIVVPKGVFDREGYLLFHVDTANSTGDSFVVDRKPPDTSRLLQLPITRIDTLVEELNLRRVDFLKFDIEGSERYALAGAKGTLGKWRPRLAIASYHRPDDLDAIPAAVKQANGGYNMECGLCEFAIPAWRLRPSVLFFH